MTRDEKLDLILKQQTEILALLKEVKPVQGTRWIRKEIDSEWLEWAIENHAGVDVEGAYRDFQDYWEGASGKRAIKSNWFSTWKNWVRRSPQKGQQDVSWKNNDVALARKARELNVEARAGESWDDLRRRVEQALRA